MEYFYLKFSAEFNELTLKFNWAPCISCPVTFPLVSTYSIRSKMYVNVRLMLQVTWSCRWRDATGDAMLQVTRCWIKIPFKSTQHENYVRCGKKMWDESLLWNNLSSSIIVFHATCSFFLFFFFRFWCFYRSKISSYMRLACWMKCGIGFLPSEQNIH